MDWELIFTICNTGVLIPWLMLLALPNWKWTQKLLLDWQVVPLMLAVVYVTLLLVVLSSSGESVDFTSFEAIKTMFRNEQAVVVGWIHYLAFDLFVGIWELKDGQKLGVPHLLIVPCLIFTLMFGPTGLLMYWIIRIIYLRKQEGKKA